MRKLWPMIAASGAAALTAISLVSGSAVADTAGWSVQPSPNPAGTTDAQLAAVACATPVICMSVGDYSGSNGYLTLAERWDGTNWTIQPMPNPPGAKNSILAGLSCAGPRWCTAVGYSFTARSVQTALAEAWNGRTWTIQPTPPPAGNGGAGLDSVSCMSPDSCMAVGAFAKPGLSAQSQPLAEYWNGSTWSIVPTPNPQAENGSSLVGISCTAASACTAGGDYDYADIAQSIFALRWNGTKWVMQRQPTPIGPNFNSDNAVSCTAASSCTTVGLLTNGGNQAETLAETWNGVRWTIQHTPNPAGNNGAALQGLSCARSSECTSVGYWSTHSNSNNTLAESLDGTRWTVQPTPNPAGAVMSQLAGVSCLPTGACMAVGSFWNGTSTQTLIEGRSG